MGKKRHNILETYNSEAPFATEFRRLLYNITKSKLLPDNSKAFLVTSASTGEGKSTISAFLGLTAATHRPRKTLLIDADLRRPVLHQLFDVEQDVGLSDIILEKAKIEECVKKTGVENLDLLTSGPRQENPTELFDSPHLATFIESARFYYELIIIDSAPVVPVSDPLIMGGEVDGIALVVKAGATQQEVVTRAANLIEQSGSRLLGVILNNVKQALPYYYNYKYYGYHYTSHK
ncbi:MAG: polysaccharide biosynthesis tyrosine autokinase [candidate division Zixibacteria bacterium]|nr:polysaccharide biosynthesis tyrosine autokinase [candidate division Zixibacteria bacterium]